MKPSSILTRSARAGFTLIELLAVIVIIAILATFIVPNLIGSGDSIKSATTRTFLDQLTTEIGSYELDRGMYPASTFPADLDPKPSPTNMGNEMLVISLLPADRSYNATSNLEERLSNTDGDNTKTSHTRFPNADAFEISDPWDNPILYLNRRDYEKGCTYLTYSDERNDWVEEKVKGARNPKTGDFYRPDSFQLISAGEDGIFGTPDDIGNFTFNN